MSKRILTALAVLLVFTCAGCASTKGAFDHASSIDTVPAYEEFLDENPDGEYADLAETRIAELRQQQKEEEQRQRERMQANERARHTSIQKLKQYKPKVTTEKQFLSDGWNAKDPSFGKIGILQCQGARGSLEITLGFVDGPPAKPHAKSGENAHAALTLAMTVYETGTLLNFGFNYQGSRHICVLQFEDGLLESIRWVE